jgi:pseudaminic acid cytidylyltransferase
VGAIAVIPARGGSKRIKNKNIIDFAGLPMIAHAINLAKSAKIFDEIVVSTDSVEIANISKVYGATVPWMRPMALAGDYVTTSEVMMHAANKLKDSHVNIEYICCIYPATPLLEKKLLIEAYEHLVNFTPDFVIPSVKRSIHRTFKIDENHKIHLNFPEFANIRTQDLEKTYVDAGQFYWGTLHAWIEGREIFGSNSMSLVVPHDEVIDIDSPSDFELALALYQKKRSESK